MGKIRGDVSVLGMANLLHFLSLNRREGVLTIFRTGERKAIHVTEQGMRLITTTRRKVNSLGEILVRSRKLSRAQLSSLLEEQKTSGRRLGEMVARMGLLSKDDIDGALREQVAEEIYDLFAWIGATFEFAERSVVNPEADSPLGELLLDSNITSLMLEAARRADEMERIRKLIPDDRQIPIKLDKSPALDDPGLELDVVEALLPLLDGKLTVRDLVENALYPEFQVLRALYALAQQGVVRVLDRRGATVLLQKDRESSAGKTVTRPGPRRTVLVVSDMPIFREALAAILRAAGYSALASDFDALSTEVPVDAAVLDLAAENADTLSLCERFRQASPAPFLVLSANASKQAIMQAVKAGARDYVVKPIKDGVLLQRLSAVLR